MRDSRSFRGRENPLLPCSMTRFRTSRRLALCSLLGVWLATNPAHAAADSFATQVSVYFSPHGGCTEAVIRELGAEGKLYACISTCLRAAPSAWTRASVQPP